MPTAKEKLSADLKVASFAELDDIIYEYVIEKRRDAMAITREIIRLRALEIARS